MTPEEHIKRFEKTINEVANHGGGELMVKLGIAADTFIKKRVIDTGVNAKGSKFPAYSTKPMLTNCSTMILSACSKVAGSKDKRRELEWKTIKGHKLFTLPGGYKQYRELMGRQTNHVDFSVTNRMWNDINIISNTNDHQNGEVEIGAKQESEKKKLSGNTKRKGDILDLNPKEILDLYRTYNLQVLQVFRNNGL